jgi:hypothetical protein
VIENNEEESDSGDEFFIETPKPKVESIGPPKILQFKPEAKEPEPEIPSPTFSIPEGPHENVNQFMKSFNVHIVGGEKCEFCDQITKPWPSINEQETISPEEVFQFYLFIFFI